MTVGELIDQLEGFDPDATVRLAIQPSWPFEHSIGEVTQANPRESLEIIRGHDEDNPGDWYILDHADEEEHGPYATCEDAEHAIVQELGARDEEDSAVYIAEAGQVGYLPGHVTKALGWR